MKYSLYFVVFCLLACSKNNDGTLSHSDLNGEWDVKGRFACFDSVEMKKIEYQVTVGFEADSCILSSVSVCGNERPFSGSNPAIVNSTIPWVYKIREGTIYFHSKQFGNVNFRWDVLSWDPPFIEIAEFYHYYDLDRELETTFNRNYVLKKLQ